MPPLTNRASPHGYFYHLNPDGRRQHLQQLADGRKEVEMRRKRELFFPNGIGRHGEAAGCAGAVSRAPFHHVCVCVCAIRASFGSYGEFISV